jgi:hypothetical protein
MMPRNIRCIPLNDIFRDFERDGLSMSWVYGNIGRILLDAKISVYGACRDIHEKVDIHRLKRAFENGDECNVDYSVGLLGSSLIENGIEDVTKICDFLLGRRASYDNLEHFQVIYNYKELTRYAQQPYAIPATITDYVKPHEWKSCSLLREFIGSEAMAFSRENQLRKLHNSTVLHVDMAEFQIEVSRISDLLSLVRSKHDSEIHNSKSSLNLERQAAEAGTPKNKGGRPPKAFWDDFWIEFFGRIHDGDLEPKSQADVKEAMIQILEDHNWPLDDRELDKPSRKAWARIEPETIRIHNDNAVGN